MRILSWNVNGIDNLIKNNDLGFMNKIRPDVVLFQNIKTQVDNTPEVFRRLNYKSILNISQSVSSDNCGTMIFTAIKEKNFHFVKEVDLKRDGRLIEILYNNVYILNISSEIGKVKTKKEKDKLHFYENLIEYVKVKMEEGIPIIIAGDFQIATNELDLTNSGVNDKYSGFLEEERAIMETFRENGFIDVFRHFNREEPNAFTFWPDRMDARRKNKGWRYDYFLVTENLIDKVIGCHHLKKIIGSNHCPIQLDIEI